MLSCVGLSVFGKDLATSKIFSLKNFLAARLSWFRLLAKHHCDHSSPYESDADHFLPGHKCKKAKSCDFAFLHLCPGKDLNLHALRHQFLRLMCLPISPPGHIYIISIESIIHENMLECEHYAYPCNIRGYKYRCIT